MSLWDSLGELQQWGSKNPDIRFRLVCQDVDTYDSDKFYAATPPLESLRFIVSSAVEDQRRQVSLADISEGKAAEARRGVPSLQQSGTEDKPGL